MDLPDKSNTIPGAITPEKKPVEKVVDGAVLVKRPASRRFKDFVMAESPKVILARVAKDTLWPRGKAVVEAGIMEFISGMFWGGGQRPTGTGLIASTMLRNGAQTYQGMSSGMYSPMSQAMQANQHRPSGNYQDVVCPDMGRAETLLAHLYDLLNRYRVVTVADLYEAAGLNTSISDGNFGWTSLDGARISKVREGFLLELPRPTIL